MTQTKTKKALLMSVLSMVLCVAMLVGMTFAWFTDTASTGVNKIVAGNLKVGLEYATEWDDAGNPTAWADAKGKTLQFKTADNRTDNILWEPGCTYKLPELRVVNKGNLALKYKVAITGITGDQKLAEVIDWKYNDAEIATSENMVICNDIELIRGEGIPFTISAHMQETANNDYQKLSIDGIAITVVATQLASEFDSIGNDYDKDAEYPVFVVGDVNKAGETVLKDKPEDHNVKLTAPSASLGEDVNKLSLEVVETAMPSGITVDTTQGATSLEVTLKDQNNNIVTAKEGTLFNVELNIGKNRTNLKLYHDGVLMTNDGETLTEASDHYIYNSTTGYVIMHVNHFSPFTAVYDKTKWTEQASEEYSTPIDEANKVVTIANAGELALLAKQVNGGKSYSGYTVKLVSNIDLENGEWVPIGRNGSAFQGVFDGQGHTISNLIINTSKECNVGLFGFTKNGEVKNFTLKNAMVKGYLEVGAVAGTPYTSKYTNIKLTGDVKVDGYSYVGGMFGKNAYANLTDLTINVSDGSYVKANSDNYRTYIGGLVGFMGEGAQVVKNVTSNIDVTGSTCDVGGITGIAHYGNSFINCLSSGDVTLTNAPDSGYELEIGGIAGVWHDQTGKTVTFEDCSYTGKLSSKLKGTPVTKFENNGLVGRKYGAGTGTLIIK